jgi:hypothetical protein
MAEARRIRCIVRQISKRKALADERDRETE